MKTRRLRLLSRCLIRDSTVHFQSSTATFEKTHPLLFVATLHHHQKRLYRDYNRCNYTRKLFITINSIRNSREENNLTYLHSYLLYSDLFLIYKQSTTCNQPFHIYRTPHSDILQINIYWKHSCTQQSTSVLQNTFLTKKLCYCKPVPPG